MTWLPWPVLAKKRWPAVEFKEKRGITLAEHRAIVARENNPERKAFYKLAWHLGYDDAGQTDVPTNSLPFVAVAAGADHNLAIAEDGTVVAWGRNDSGQANVPTNVIATLSIAAGDSHSLALLESGAVVAWGDDSYGQTDLPPALTGYWWYAWANWYYTSPQPARAIAAGHNHNLALMDDGTVVGWGDDSFGQSSSPPGLSNVVAIAAGYLHSVALRSDGTVLAWGDNSYDQTNVPVGLSNVVAIAAGDFHTLALLSNGALVGWGDDTFGQLESPSSVTNSVGVACGYYHALALVPFKQILQPRMTPSGLLIHWNGTGTLQWAPTPTGPFTDLPSQGNSWTNSELLGPAEFFRVRQ
jgi:alpha-tubulin suppressor-like RCC1 family protein